MNYLVTGAGGFVGSALCHELVHRQQRCRRALRHDVADGGDGSIAIGDIHGTTDWSAALKDVSAIVHLAAHVHAPKSAEASGQIHCTVNTEGTLNLARQAAAAGVRRMVFVSTVKVLGEGSDEPYTEADEPQPQDAYSLSKLSAETGLRQIAAETGLEVCILRPPLVYGPGVRANLLQLLRWVDRGLPLPLAGVCNQRSLISVRNLVDAIVTCLEHPAAANATFLVSDGTPLSTPDLVRLIAAALGRPARLWYCPVWLLRALSACLGQGERVDRLVGSLAVEDRLIRTRLGWNPPQTVAAAMAETVVAYRGGM